jgi:hypothetical protein
MDGADLSQRPFVVHSNEPASLQDVVTRLNNALVTLHGQELHYRATGTPETWCRDTALLIQRYNAFAEKAHRLPTPSMEVQHGAGITTTTILVFRGAKAIETLQQAGIRTVPLPEKPDKEAATQHLKTAFAAISPERISKRGNHLFIQGDQQALMNLNNLIGDYNVAHDSVLGMSKTVFDEHGVHLSFTDGCNKSQLNLLAELGLRFPGHELHARLHRAEETNRGLS